MGSLESTIKLFDFLKEQCRKSGGKTVYVSKSLTLEPFIEKYGIAYVQIVNDFNLSCRTMYDKKPITFDASRVTIDKKLFLKYGKKYIKELENKAQDLNI